MGRRGAEAVRRARLVVSANEAVGPYTLVRLGRGRLEPGEPGQFFMLEAPGRLLPRPFSLCLAPDGELGFLVDPIGPGTRAIAGLEVGERIAVTGPLGRGYDLDVERPLLVGGGIGIAPLPYLSEPARRAARGPRLPDERARRGRGARPERDGRARPDARHRGAARPTPATCSPAGRSRCSTRSQRLVPGAQLAHEAPMACGYGACYGCVVPRDGGYVRLCVDGPVLRAAA